MSLGKKLNASAGQRGASATCQKRPIRTHSSMFKLFADTTNTRSISLLPRDHVEQSCNCHIMSLSLPPWGYTGFKRPRASKHPPCAVEQSKQPFLAQTPPRLLDETDKYFVSLLILIRHLVRTCVTVGSSFNEFLEELYDIRGLKETEPVYVGNAK